MTDGVETAELIIQVEHCWSTDYRVGLSGWAVSKVGCLERLELLCGDASVPIAQWLSRPDIRLRYPEYLADDRCGFVVEIERRATHRLEVKARINGEIAFAAFKAHGQEPTKDTSSPALPIWAKFIAEVNERKLQVLEIGSRCFLPSSESRRHFFTDGLYTGFDYHPGDNVDVVGDAHCLTRFFEGRKFGAIFSLSVMEHLAMPWVAALEMIKLLDVGGVAFHHVPAAWPPHERPSDFWRMSPDGLRVLFPPTLGMRVEAISHEFPLHLYFDHPLPGQELFPKAPAYAFSGILLRKVAEVDHSALRWFGSHDELLGGNNRYPAAS